MFVSSVVRTVTLLKTVLIANKSFLLRLLLQIRKAGLELSLQTATLVKLNMIRLVTGATSVVVGT